MRAGHVMCVAGQLGWGRKMKSIICSVPDYREALIRGGQPGSEQQ